MLLHILKKDLKRKRTVNLILLLFIIMAATFLAGSVNNLVTILGAVDHFLEMAKTPDFITIAAGDESETTVEDFLKSCEFVSEYEVMELHTLMDGEIEIVSCAQDPQKHTYEKGNTVAVGTVPDNFMKVFEETGGAFQLDPGEIAIPRLQAKENELQTGDVLKISCGEKAKEFTVKVITKDAVFGSEFMGFKRLLIAGEDYEWLFGENAVRTWIYGINYTDREAFTKEFNRNDFQVISGIEGSVVKMCYVFDMLLAGILMIVSLCLILISFLILRFTIVFTLQEDYKEIGVMKAIGIRDLSIKGIYLLKYLAIAVLGAAVGLGISFPFEKLLLSQTITNLVVSDVENKAEINILCAIAIVLIVLLFCYSSTGKVKKFTAIEAIRNGGNGERYAVKNPFRLHSGRRIPATFYMACNDIISDRKRYTVLAAIFCIGTLLILLPLKAVHTLKDKSIIRSFSMQTASVFINTGGAEKYILDEDDTGLLSDLEKIRKTLDENGLEATVWTERGYSIPCYGKDPEMIFTYYTFQLFGEKEEDYDVIEGKVPVLPNEVMVTEIVAKELGVGIGDYIYYQYPDREEAFLVTGIYQSMMNMGKGLRVSREAELERQYISGILSVQAEIDSDMDEEELRELVQTIFPDYQISTCREFVNGMIGGILDQLDALQMMIGGVVLLINILITVLMMKTLITRERGEIAMLKSIGFSDRALKAWQSLRILLVLAVAILLGTLFSKPLSVLALGPIFSMMGGTRIKLVTRPLEAYVIYPLLLLFVTGIAAYICAAAVKKVELKEINTLE
ncbi:MAG: FtsX-like permease family protein [Eubacteriales bacterium]|nr:FtsX-like permease family protein [Eubacteriales bacterium]